MIFLNKKTSKPASEVSEVLSYYLENEKHNPFLPIEDFDDGRVGIHTYSTDNGFYGYYETGARNRYGSLLHNKSWFTISMNETGNDLVVKGLIQARPPVWLLLAVLLIVSLVFFIVGGANDIEALLLWVVTGVLAYIDYKEERTLHDELVRLLGLY